MIRGDVVNPELIPEVTPQAPPLDLKSRFPSAAPIIRTQSSLRPRNNTMSQDVLERANASRLPSGDHSKSSIR